MSRLGQLLDPAADRLYILATLIGLTVRDVVPLWLTLALVGRDVFLAFSCPVLRRHGYGPLPVHFLGKAATFNLLVRVPAAAPRRGRQPGEPGGPRVRLGIRDLGYRPVLVGRSPLRRPGDVRSWARTGRGRVPA